MAATTTTVRERDADRADLFLTGRELVVLAVALAIVVGAVLLLVLTSHQLAGSLSKPA